MSVRNILMLDVDGVLNTAATFKAFRTGHTDLTKMIAGLDIDKLHRLKQINDLVHPEIILSSSWRLVDYVKAPLVEQLALLGITLAGATDFEPNFDKTIYNAKAQSRNRGQEIADWLNKNATLEDRVVILDDSTYASINRVNTKHFLSHITTGLTEEITQQVINFFLGENHG